MNDIKNQAKHHGINQHLFCKYLGDDHKIFNLQILIKKKRWILEHFKGKHKKQAQSFTKGRGDNERKWKMW